MGLARGQFALEDQYYHNQTGLRKITHFIIGPEGAAWVIYPIVGFAWLAAGYASLQTTPTEAIAKLPVVRVGDQPPQKTEHVAFYPAGLAFPVKLKANGLLFAAEKQVESQVALAKDLYLYKHWASHDGKKWKNSHELLGGECGGGFDITGLQANIKLEVK